MISNSKEFDMEYLSLKNEYKTDEMTELQSFETANEDEEKSIISNSSSSKNEIECANSSINDSSANYSSKEERKTKKLDILHLKRSKIKGK